MNILLQNIIRLPEGDWDSEASLVPFYKDDFMPTGQTFLDYLPLASDIVLPVNREDLIKRGYLPETIDYSLSRTNPNCFSPSRMWLLLPAAKDLPFYTEPYTGLQIPQLILSDDSCEYFASNNGSIALALDYLQGCDSEDSVSVYLYAHKILIINKNKVAHRGDLLKKQLLSDPVLYFREYGKKPRLLSPDKVKNLTDYLTNLKYCRIEIAQANQSNPLGELIAVSPDTLQASVMKLTEDALIFHRFGFLRFLEPKEAINLFF